MVGQINLLNKIDHIQNLPHSILLIGESGSGKHLIADHIASKFDLQTICIDDKLDFEHISEFNMNPIPTLYIVNQKNITEKQENTLLKFLEEPISTAFIIIISQTANILPTVKSRCQIWVMDKYHVEELSEFTTDMDILHIATTPGQVIKLQNCKLPEYIDFANKVIDKIRIANYSNIMSIPNRLDFDKSGDKFDVDIFIRILRYLLFERVINEKDTVYLELFKRTDELVNNTEISHINLKLLFENYLLDIKNIWTSEN